MTPAALRLLAFPADPAERRRMGLVALACALVGALALAGLRVLRFTSGSGDYSGHWDRPVSPYVAEQGLRAGVVAGAVLAALPPLVLLIQAVRMGSAARERRLRLLRVNGASRHQLRRVTTFEGAAAGLVGGLAAGPLYALLGLLLSSGPQLIDVVPRATALDLVLWPAVAVLLAAVAGAAARLSAYEVQVSPQPVSTRVPRPLRRSRAVIVVGLAVLTVAAGFSEVSRTASVGDGTTFVAIALLVATLFAAAPYLVALAARRQSRSSDPMALVSAARLQSDLRGPGRAAAVVAVCGATIALTAALSSQNLLTSQTYAENNSFYVVGDGLAAVVAVIALLVSGLSLMVGAAEQILDGRRAAAALSAFGIDRADLSRIVRLQLRASTVPAVALGAGLIVVFSAYDTKALLFALVGLVVAVSAAELATRLATRLLRAQIHDAADVANLRTA